jgi:nicotinamide-nucleotide amidase
MTNTTDEALRDLASSLGEQLAAKRLTLCTAESCTGGWIAKTVTDIPGSSAWFDCGMAAYSYEAKQALLGVRPETLEHFGAVSRETVIEMVRADGIDAAYERMVKGDVKYRFVIDCASM